MNLLVRRRVEGNFVAKGFEQVDMRRATGVPGLSCRLPDGRLPGMPIRYGVRATGRQPSATVHPAVQRGRARGRALVCSLTSWWQFVPIRWMVAAGRSRSFSVQSWKIDVFWPNGPPGLVRACPSKERLSARRRIRAIVGEVRVTGDDGVLAVVRRKALWRTHPSLRSFLAPAVLPHLRLRDPLESLITPTKEVANCHEAGA